MDDHIFKQCAERKDAQLLSAKDFDSLNIIGVLGKGAFSIVYQIVLDDKLYALRIADVNDEDNDELDIGCIANELRPYTHSLQVVKYFAYFDNSIKSSLLRLDKELDTKHLMFNVLDIMKPSYRGSYLATVSEILINTNYDELIDNKEDLIDYTFELFMALHILNIHDIVHGDLHDGNVGTIKTKAKRAYRINGTDYLVTSNLMPVVFDYGKAQITFDDTIESYELLSEFESIMFLFTEEERESILYARNVKEFKKVFDLPIFDHLRNRSIVGEGETVIIFKEI
mgnify:CR=1 FL=1|tara:strand:+ start:914 stop:1765 length:852 start_codon:yes stop_codon:yes gene_type:complete